MVQQLTQRLSILNQPPRQLEGPAVLHELVSQSSGVSAIEFLEYGTKIRKFSYHTLHALSDILAQRIINLTATLENASVVIPVLLPQSPELYVVLLAILKAGKAFCPLNLDIPDERLKFILSDVSADILITTSELSSRSILPGDVNLVCVEQELRQAGGNIVTALPHVKDTDLAYVLYTSGSTGLPKAVNVAHKAVAQSLLAHDRHIPAFKRFLQFAAPTFDVSIFEIFFPLFRGSTLVGSSRSRMLEDLPGVINILKADAAELTPTVAGNLLQGRASVPGLTLLLTIGEMLTQHVVSEYGDSETRAGILWAMYGPTEAAIHCTLQANFSANDSTGNIGYPLDTVSAFVLAPCQSTSRVTEPTILERGEAGELALGGYQIAEGYLNRPDLTAAAFADHPVYGRLYRTGDRARFRDDGTIEFLGRIVGGQVKLRGQRVELGEIEQVIMKVRGCRVAVVMIINDNLVAFCTTDSQTTSRMEVLEVCKKWLPAFMTPSDVLIVPNMPQLSSGKVDKRSLEMLYLESHQIQRTADTCTDDLIASTVLRLSEESLGHKLSLHTDLSAAGLDSLRAIRLASSLRAEGYDVSAVALLAVHTLQDLVRACKENPSLLKRPSSARGLSFGSVDTSSVELALEEEAIDVISPCTPLQEAMLTETLSRPGAYCNWVELELSITRSYNEIFAALKLLAKYNSILRSGFCSSTSSTQTFVQITWKELDQAQCCQVPIMQKSCSLDTAEALLRPFKVQVQDSLGTQRILVQLHHALYDGWSFDLLLVDLDKILRGFEPTTRPQFQEVSQYYIERHQTSAPAEDTTYWSRLLQDYVPTHLVNYNGETKITERLQSYKTSSSVKAGQLSEKARTLGINPQVFFQAAVGYILSLYVGSSDVVFGNVTSGRTLPITGIEDIVGPCIASLPCRLDFSAFSCVQEVLEQTHCSNREGLQHCALPLRDIAKAVNVQSGTRLFDTLFVWQQSSTSELSSSLAAKIVDSADELEFKLTLEFEPHDDSISFRATFDPSAMPQQQIAFMARQIDEVVEVFLGDGSCTVADIGRGFNSASLSVANAEYRRSNDNVSLSHAVETWAEYSPDKEAVVFGHIHHGAIKVKTTLTYSSLNQRANQLAHLLAKHGVGQDHLVCIMMEKSVDLYVSILAVLKLGSGYLPLVPETPVERINAILEDAQVMVCVSDFDTSRCLQQVFSGTIIDISATDLSELPRHNLGIPYNGSYIAYAVFTSGSTGTPKGVLVTQKNLMSNLKFLAGLYPASKESRMLQSCSQAFDVSVFEIFYAWHVGMTLCTAKKEDMFRDIEESINNLGATHLSLTPTVAALVNPDNVPQVEFLVTAGEALTEHVRRQWANRGLYQGYGPSETTNICTVRPSVTSTDLINNIGPPFDNTSAFVIDPDSDIILPRGAVGELCFGGEQVFRGYLNRPDLNATRLIDIAPYGKIYRSGDMGRLLPNDCILSAGRSDDQVKIRGQRVELGEITSVVLDDSAVTDCVTLLLSINNQTQVLGTFWVPQSARDERFATLEAKPFKSTMHRIFLSLQRRLPAYMVPSYLIPVSNLPMTAQTKIDKRLLNSTFEGLSDDDLSQAAPTHRGIGDAIGDGNGASLSTWQNSVAGILAKVLKIKAAEIRQTSSFFNLGLDSVSAIRFCHSLRRSGLGDFTVAEVLKNPTIAYLDAIRVNNVASGIAQKLSLEKLSAVFTDEQQSQIHSTFSATGSEVEKIYPCTPLQEAMLASSVSSEVAYSNTMIFNIKGDVSRLRRCWELMQKRHEILRTAFIPSEHSNFVFAQVVLKDPELRCDQLDTLDGIRSYMDIVLSNLLVSHEPPLCLATYESGSSVKLVFSCHHALYDGIAIENLLAEIQFAYCDGALPATISYGHYLQHVISQDLAEADKFWSNKFTGFEPTYFPDLTGRVRQHPGKVKFTVQDLQLPLSVLRIASQDLSVSVLAMVQAAWAKLLHYYTGEHDLGFGNIVSGRAIPEEGLDKLVAPCFNTLPVRAQFDFSNPNSALVRLLHESNVDSLAYQLTALRRIQRAALRGGERLFDTLVILQQPSRPLDGNIWAMEADLGEMDLPVVCEVHQDEQRDCLRLTLHYNTGLMSDEDAQLVAQTFDHSLCTLARNHDAAADDTTNLPQSLKAESNMRFKRSQPEAITICNGTGTDMNTSNLLHTAFEQNASSRQRDCIALDFLHSDGRRTHWSYRELNLIANRIAHRLMHRGIGPEDIVPIHMRKSPMFYASILGILKAGAAFAPVHPELPEARKEFMLQELSPNVVLCTDRVPECAKPLAIATISVEDLEKPDWESCEMPHIEALTGSNLAYCLYTSGSTGVPKAVSMEHQSPVQTIESSRSLVPWNSSSRLMQYAATTFDMCYYDCFMAWTFGFTLCAAEQHVMFDNLSHVINTLGVTLLDLTPSVAMSLSRAEVPSVQWLYCIGEAMSEEVAKEWSSACVNSYGPTEGAFCTTMFPMSQDIKTSVIGQPYPSTSFAVFSSHGQHPLPVLSIGELYIGGAQLARGYLGRSELTAERFVTRCGQRFYKTGDMVRMLTDGNFEFIGRADDQIKIRGLRVELGEISQVLQSCDLNIKSVVVQIMKKDARSKEQLVAFLVADNTTKTYDESDLRRKAMQAAKSHLPSYMVPQFYLFLERIPISMAGKIDKKILAEMFKTATATDELSIEANSTHEWTPIEIDIRDVFSRLSRTPIEEVLPETSIYQLGLDSISAVQISAALRRLSYEASASDVLRFNNCVDLARYLEQRSQTTNASIEEFDFDGFDKQHRAVILENCGLESQSVDAVRPCTPLQQGIVSQFLAKNGSVYYNYLRLKLNKPFLDVQRLNNAWAKVMSRHPMLRTGFAHIEEKEFQFAMVQYQPGFVTLPWSEGSDTDPRSAASRSSQLQQKALTQLHQPMWDLHLVIDSQDAFLDLCMFHALFDAQSLQLIFDDVQAFYEHQLPSEIIPLEPVLSEILQLTNSHSNQTEEFWLGVKNKIVPSRFPNLAPLKHEPKYPEVLARISSMSYPEIEDGCRASNTTLQAVGIASWSAILAAYTGERNVTIGVVLSGRLTEVAGKAVFPCINTVPFPCTVTQDRVENLRSVTSMNTEIHQHQLTPLNKIQRLMDSPNEPLFDSLFAFQKTARQTQQRNLWTIVDENATTEYPVSIELELKYEALEYRLTYLEHVIPRKQAELILAQLDHMMKKNLTAKSGPNHDNIFDQLLYSITPSKEPTLPSVGKLLHEFVEISADTHPYRRAFEFASSIHDAQTVSTSWTYQELDAEGNRIAHLLLAHGVQQGGLVGVCFDKCPEASFAMLGILKAGCAFVAIDPSAPSARQAFIVADSSAQLVLSMAAQSAKFSENLHAPVLNLDEITTRDFSTLRPQLPRTIDPHDRSYCLYTSGTTGTPKGCELTHENAVQALLAFQRLFAGHWDETSRWLQFASFHFDVSVLEQYWSWSVGICVVSAPRDLIFEDLANSIKTLDITHIDLTPSLAQILHPDDVPSLCKGIFITGGESLKQEILDVWGPKRVIYNGYGPTEATIGCTMYPRVPINGKPSNIGPQFDNVGSYVLQPDADIPVLRGGVGELCVSGKLVGKGYLNRPELTEERFAYLNRFGERVYRTGDLVRILHDGTFDFLGRADDQVKLRGQRLEIGEINSVIRQSRKHFTDVATLVLKHPQQQKEQLVSFVVIGNGSPRATSFLLPFEGASLGEAKEACYDKLPPYMIPTHFVPLASMPLNINNKADGKQLKQIYESLNNSDLQKLSTVLVGTQSWTKQEERLRRVLMQALHVSRESIDKNSSFYELGMDSISVIGVSRALKEAGFATASAATVLKHASIFRLAKVLSSPDAGINHNSSLISAQQAISAAQHRYRGTVARALAVDPRDIEALAPCTPLQQGMIARYLDSDDGLYFNTFTFELDPSVNIDRLRKAWNDVYHHTQILRTAFVDTKDGHVQAVLKDIELPWCTQITTSVSQAACMQEARQTWLTANRAEVKRPLELHAICTKEQRTLVVQIFHGLYDGNSIELLFESVRKAYEAEAVEVRDAPTFHEVLPHGPLRLVEGAQRFWQDHFTSTSSRRLSPLLDKSGPCTVVVTRDLDTNEAYDLVRRDLKVTAQAIAQACWMHVIQEYVGMPITTGIVVSGRNIEIEHADLIIGPMFNTIPYSQRTQIGDTWASLIRRAHEFNAASLPYQHTSLRDIMKWCRRSPDQSLFDALFVYQVSNSDNIEWRSTHLWTLRDGNAVADYPLAIEIDQKSHNKFTLTLVTGGGVANEETSNDLLDRFEAVLTSALTDPATVVETSISVDESNSQGPRAVNHITNGMNRTQIFQWTNEATAIREEIENLTNIDVECINEGTSIFELGLDSIDAIKLSSRLKRHGVNLPVSGIMRGLTVEGMVNHIQTIQASGTESPVEDVFARQKRELRHYVESQDVDASKIDNVLPLTPLQEAMVAEMKASDYTRYFNFDVAELAADTDADRLCNAWRTVIASTPILRTAFVEVDDSKLDATFAQIVVKDESLNLVEPRQQDDSVQPDFSAIFERLRRTAVESKILDPPIRITYVETFERVYQILSIAHALYDGWSLNLLNYAVNDAYNGKNSQALDYELTLANIVTASGAAAADFWKDYLTDAKPSMFARRQVEAVGLETVHRLELSSAANVSDITAFARDNKVSLQTVGQSVYAMVVASYVGSLDVTFGCVLSGRDDDKTSQLLFPTMNTVAIRTVLHGSRLQLLQYVQDNFNNLKQWQHFPLRKASSLMEPPGKLFDSLFIYQKSLKQGAGTEQKLYNSIESRSDVEYPVCVEMELVNNTLVWRCAIKDEVLDQDGAQALLENLDSVLHSIMQSLEAPTIVSTPQGVSVCGLPAFKEKHLDSPDSRTPTGLTTHSVYTPLSKTSLQIRNVLASVAQVPETDIEPGMSIFHIGLDSISAIKVSSTLRKQGISISVGEMLRAGTVRKMGEVIDKRTESSTSGNDDASTAIKRALRGLDRDQVFQQAGVATSQFERSLPLTAGQLYMLSMWLNTRGGNFYPDFVYSLKGHTTFKTLQKSWEGLVAANSILRTQIIATGQTTVPYIQAVLKGANASMVDITGQDDATAAHTITEAARQQPWAHLFASRTELGWKLTFKIHHVLYDGVSLPLLMQQLQAYCNGSAAAQSTSAFNDYIAIAHTTPAFSQRQAFWTSYLSGLVPELASKARSPVGDFKTEVFRPALLDTVVLEQFARRTGVSTHALFLAAYARLHAKRHRCQIGGDVVVGAYLANRGLPVEGLEGTTCPTVNLLPLRVRTESPSTSFLSSETSPPRTSPPASLIDAAKQIQDDLRALSEPAIATSSLAEIARWTDVTVDIFVNFLALPSAHIDDFTSPTSASGEASDSVGVRDIGDVEIVPQHAWTQPISKSSKVKIDGNEMEMEQMRVEHVNQAYLHAIDVEATVRNGYLNVGIFAPTSMMSVQEGEEMIADLKNELERLGRE